MRIDVLTPAEWAPYSERAHSLVFGKQKPADWDRIDFALVTADGDKPLSYVTCRELDSQSLYWQFGGSFPDTKGTVTSKRSIHMMLDVCRAKYKRVSFLVENTNKSMLKMAMMEGFLIVGMRNFKGSILLEHLLEFEPQGG